MKSNKIGTVALAIPLAITMIFTPEMADARNKKDNIAIGIGLGLLGGLLVSRGDPAAAIGGAVAGGVIGGVATDHNRHRRREWRHDYRPHDRDRRGDRYRRY